MFVRERERERERERAFFGPKYRELFERESRYESKVFIGFPLVLLLCFIFIFLRLNISFIYLSYFLCDLYLIKILIFLRLNLSIEFFF